MIAYLDASVILRLVLGQTDQLAEWPEVSAGVVSALAEVECLRTLDRLRTERSVPEAIIASRREAVYHFMRSIEIVETTRAVLERASQPLPTTLGTLDAIHLATAMLWSERTQTELVIATHDRALGRAARASGFAVLGVPAGP
ncbi:MAG: type II toxin-antitoxin system VapC family toxin [bacterium]|nr:type II toxin-antitoxin system VapC family toxin [bacterium]